ncbi:hypothetical protein PHYSODRAFT_506204, partial [Phytophthora sojae]
DVRLPLIEATIAAELPHKFAVMFDGWKHRTTHYVAVFAVYVKDNESKGVLLGISPPLDCCDYTSLSTRRGPCYESHGLRVGGACL